MKLYSELAEWWPLLSPREDYAAEAEVYKEILLGHSPVPRTLLELGSGGGNNASFMKKSFEMTLSDAAEGMLAVSRRLNPECAHVQGDMRTLRLDKTFDAVFVHDAICYMTTEADLRQVFETAFIHCRPGGIALFAPDYVKEAFVPSTEHDGEDGANRSLRYLEWVYDPDPDDTTYEVEYIVAVREGLGPVRVIQDHHVEGIFPRGRWIDLLTAAGFEAEGLPDPIEPGRELFVARKA